MMIISSPNGSSTLILVPVPGRSVYIRGGGNNSAHQLVISAAGASFSGNLAVTGNLTVSGTTTTIDTANLNVEDNNITLNYSTGDSSSAANGAGITIQDAVNSTTDATILWDATNDEFDFSHAVNINGKITGNNEFRLDNGTGGTTHLNYQDGGSNYIRGTTTYIDTLLDLNSNNITDVGTLSSGTITTSGTLDFTANPAYIRNDQDNSGQIIISAKNSSGSAQQVRWDAGNASTGAWRPEVTGVSNLGLTNRVWGTLYVNNIRMGSGNNLLVDANRNITSGAITTSGDIQLDNGKAIKSENVAGSVRTLS